MNETPTSLLHPRTEPHAFAIADAIAIANRSPCAKSKRGALVYMATAEHVTLGAGFNGPPEPFVCTGSPHCREHCAKRCVHAEQRAIANALRRFSKINPTNLAGAELVHVKTVDGVLVPGGGPSCWQCSRLVLEHRLDGVWLYEDRGPTSNKPEPGGAPMWTFYNAVEFHRRSLAHNGISTATEIDTRPRDL